MVRPPRCHLLCDSECALSELLYYMSYYMLCYAFHLCLYLVLPVIAFLSAVKGAGVLAEFLPYLALPVIAAFSAVSGGEVQAEAFAAAWLRAFSLHLLLPVRLV
mmetsp:Transcript_53632/g.115861  ORF Transcript_53632/g.115861 Transcript_53632/m.115861 type:complete len:104 (-) Transcript_53632:160-471(-)